MLGQIAGDLGLLRGRGDGPANATFEEQSDGNLGGWAWTHPKPRNDNRRYNGQIGTVGEGAVPQVGTGSFTLFKSSAI